MKFCGPLKLCAMHQQRRNPCKCSLTVDLFMCTILQVFLEWNRGELESFLIEITSDILKYHDANNDSLVDKIIDKAGQVKECSFV